MDSREFDSERIRIHVSNGRGFVWSGEDAAFLRESCRVVGTLVGCLPRAPRQNVHLGLPLQLLPEEVSLLREKGFAVLLSSNKLKYPSTGEEKAFKQLRKKTYEEQIPLFHEDRRLEILHKFLEIKEGKKAKRNRLLEKMRQNGEDVDDAEFEKDVDIDVDKITIPQIPQKFTFVQMFTENPWKELEAEANWTFPSTPQEKLRYRVFKEFWERDYYLSAGSKFGGDFLVYPGDPSRYHSFFIACCLPHGEKMKALDIAILGRLGTNVRKTVVICSLDDQGKVYFTSLQWRGMGWQ